LAESIALLGRFWDSNSLLLGSSLILDGRAIRTAT
jgi:hypothetical protein